MGRKVPKKDIESDTSNQESEMDNRLDFEELDRAYQDKVPTFDDVLAEVRELGKEHLPSRESDPYGDAIEEADESYMKLIAKQIVLAHQHSVLRQMAADLHEGSVFREGERIDDERALFRAGHENNSLTEALVGLLPEDEKSASGTWLNFKKLD